MQLTEADIDQFRDIYHAHFGVELTTDEARHQLALLVRQLEIVYRPITPQQLTDINNQDNTPPEQAEQ